MVAEIDGYARFQRVSRSPFHAFDLDRIDHSAGREKEREAVAAAVAAAAAGAGARRGRLVSLRCV